MAPTLVNRAPSLKGRPPVADDQASADKQPASDAYVIESIEYIPSVQLPYSELFDDFEERGRLLDYTRASIEDLDSSGQV
jgi:hypothetical protein